MIDITIGNIKNRLSIKAREGDGEMYFHGNTLGDLMYKIANKRYKPLPYQPKAKYVINIVECYKAGWRQV